jgi:hypothetical protein
MESPLHFVVRSQLTPTECSSRLSSRFEGPIPKLGTRLVGWHVFGQAKAGRIEATIVGVKVTPDGRKRGSLRPLIRAQFSPAQRGTVVSGEIASRGSGGQPVFARLAAVAVAILIGAWTLVSLSTRWPILAFDVVGLSSVLLAWFIRMRFGPLRAEGETELLAWLEQTIDGKRDDSTAVGI